MLKSGPQGVKSTSLFTREGAQIYSNLPLLQNFHDWWTFFSEPFTFRGKWYLKDMKKSYTSKNWQIFNQKLPPWRKYDRTYTQFYPLTLYPTCTIMLNWHAFLLHLYNYRFNFLFFSYTIWCLYPIQKQKGTSTLKTKSLLYILFHSLCFIILYLILRSSFCFFFIIMRSYFTLI